MRPLYLDESVWIPVADGLRRRDWEVHTAREHGLLGEPDAVHLALALEHDWILFTFDDDFLALIKAEGHDHAGLIYTDQSHKRVGDVVKALDAFLDGLDSEWRGIHYL